MSRLFRLRFALATISFMIPFSSHAQVYENNWLVEAVSTSYDSGNKHGSVTLALSNNQLESESQENLQRIFKVQIPIDADLNLLSSDASFYGSVYLSSSQDAVSGDKTLTLFSSFVPGVDYTVNLVFDGQITTSPATVDTFSVDANVGSIAAAGVRISKLEFEETDQISDRVLVRPTENDCPVLTDYMGDTTYEWISQGSGSSEWLPTVLQGLGITKKFSSEPINTGALSFIVDQQGGLSPDFSSSGIGASDQLNLQRFLATEDVSLELVYSGLGGAGYRSHFGVYYYAQQDDTESSLTQAGTITFQRLFTQNVTQKGTKVDFQIPKNHFFGFYLVANGNPNTGKYFTENRFNSDNSQVDAFDLQRPDGVTDHFVFFNTNRGLLIAIEDLALNSSSKKLGDQDYEDLIVAELSCDGKFIEPTTLAIDTGAPQNSRYAGLESNGDMAVAYSAREYIKSRGRSSSGAFSLSRQTEGSLLGVTATTSFLKDQVAFKRKPPNFSLATQNVDAEQKILKSLESVGMEYSSYEDSTPQDIPFVSNAQFAVAMNLYEENKRVGSVFSTLSIGKPYNHSKTICDRTKGSIIENAELMSLGFVSAYSVRTKNPIFNRDETAVFFDVELDLDANTLGVSSDWKPWEKTEQNRIFASFQVWGFSPNEAAKLARSVLSQFVDLDDPRFGLVEPAPPTHFVRSFRLENNLLKMAVANTTTRKLEVKLDYKDVRANQFGEHRYQPSERRVLKPGLNYVVHEFDEPMFDVLLNLSTDVSDFVDTIFGSSGAYTIFQDEGSGGEIELTMSEECPDYNIDFYTRVMLPGCVELNSTVAVGHGIYRSILNRSLFNSSHVQFYLATDNEVNICLETRSGRYFCKEFDGQGDYLVSVSEFIQGVGRLTTEYDVIAVSIHRKSLVPGRLVFGSLNFVQARPLWQMVALDKEYESISSLARSVSSRPILFVGWQEDEWHVWTNNEQFAESVWPNFDEYKRLEEKSTGIGVFAVTLEPVSFPRPAKSSDQQMLPGWNLYAHSDASMPLSQWLKENPEVEVVWSFDGDNWLRHGGGGNFAAVTYLNRGSSYWVKVAGSKD